MERLLEQAGVPWTLHQPVRGREASEEIVRAAHEARADLVVIGLRHRSPVGKLIMGSTAQSVLLDAECPVLAVKARALSLRRCRSRAPAPAPTPSRPAGSSWR